MSRQGLHYIRICMYLGDRNKVLINVGLTNHFNDVHKYT